MHLVCWNKKHIIHTQFAYQPVTLINVIPLQTVFHSVIHAVCLRRVRQPLLHRDRLAETKACNVTTSWTVDPLDWLHFDCLPCSHSISFQISAQQAMAVGEMSWKHQQDYTVGSVFRSLRVGCQSEVVVIESLFHTDPNKCHIVMIMIVCHILGHQSLLLWVQSNHIDTVHIFLDSVVRTLPDHLQINIHESTQKS